MSVAIDSQMNTIKHMVRQALMDVTETRWMDNLLTLHVWEAKVQDPEVKALFRRIIYLLGPSGVEALPQMESIRRTRQLIQHDEGDLKPPPDIQSARMRREKSYREWARKRAS